MQITNIRTGKSVEVHDSSSINNIQIGDNVKIAKRCSLFGSADNILEIGSDSYIGMNTILNGYAAKLKIGSNVSIGQNVNIMTNSGPNASEILQRIFPVIEGEVIIGDHTWIGASVIITPGVEIGDFCIIGANSFVTSSFPSYSIIGGTPAKLLRMLTKEEIDKLK